MLRIDRFTHVGRVNGVNLFVHWSVFAIAAVMLFGIAERPITTLAGIACWMGVLLLHECGHMIAAQKRGSRVYEIKLYPIFAITVFETPWSRFDHAIIAWGGVLAQAIVAIPVLLVVKCFGYTPVGVVNEVLAIFGVLNVVIAFFNLLPFKGLDGATAWQIVPAFLERNRNRKAKSVAGWKVNR